MKKVDAFPIVKPGSTTFYIVTANGVFGYTAREDDLGEERDKKLSGLFHQCHSLITQMRITDEKRRQNKAALDNPLPAPSRMSEGGDKPQPESEGRSR